MRSAIKEPHPESGIPKACATCLGLAVLISLLCPPSLGVLNPTLSAALHGSTQF